MNISFIGAGKAGLSLGKYFKKKGHNIKFVFDVLLSNSIAFKDELGADIASLETIVNNSDFVFLTVNDSVIYELWENIKKIIINRDVIFIHCSGAKEGVYDYHTLYSLHPASPMTGQGDLEDICFGLENEGEKIETIKTFIESLENRVFLIPKSKKREYHLANVFVSNMVLSLVEKAVSYLSVSGLSEKDSLALLMPLAEQNLLNILNKGIRESVTGPVARGDREVVEGHLAIIKEEDLELYKTLSKNILKILNSKNDIENILK